MKQIMDTGLPCQLETTQPATVAVLKLLAPELAAGIARVKRAKSARKAPDPWFEGRRMTYRSTFGPTMPANRGAAPPGVFSPCAPA